MSTKRALKNRQLARHLGALAMNLRNAVGILDRMLGPSAEPVEAAEPVAQPALPVRPRRISASRKPRSPAPRIAAALEMYQAGFRQDVIAKKTGMPQRQVNSMVTRYRKAGVIRDGLGRKYKRPVEG